MKQELTQAEHKAIANKLSEMCITLQEIHNLVVDTRHSKVLIEEINDSISQVAYTKKVCEKRYRKNFDLKSPYFDYLEVKE